MSAPLPIDESLIEYIDLFEEKSFSPKQAEVFLWYREQRRRRLEGLHFERILCLPWGRRCGKSHGTSNLFAEMCVDRLCDLSDRVAVGELAPWSGIGQTRKRARKARVHDLAFVVAPSSRDLRDIAGHLFGVFNDEAAVFLHDDETLSIDERGGRILLCHEGAALAIDLIPARQSSALVGRGVSLVLFSEAGFIETQQYLRFSPSLWDSDGIAICEGTPTQDLSHWYTQLIVSGLPDKHPKADRKIAKRNPLVHTIAANTIEHAYLKTAREAARREAKYRGERWAKLWIFGDHQPTANIVFDTFRREASVVKFRELPLMRLYRGKEVEKLPDPDERTMWIDWHDGSSPGAVTVVYVYYQNPIDEDDPRSLLIVVGEAQDDEERMSYTKDGWYGTFKTLANAHGVTSILADPTSPQLIKQARRHHIYIRPASNEDKLGRIESLSSQMTVSPKGWPALLIADNCTKTINSVAKLQWRKDKEGRPTSAISGYDDHLVDTLAYCAGKYVRPMSRVPDRLT